MLNSTQCSKFFIFNHYILLAAILPFYSIPSINHSRNLATLPRKTLPRKRLTNICIFHVPSYVPKFSFFSLLLHMYYRYHMTMTMAAGTGTLVQNDHDDNEQSSPTVTTTLSTTTNGDGDKGEQNEGNRYVFLFICFLSMLTNIFISTMMTPNSQHHQYQQQ